MKMKMFKVEFIENIANEHREYVSVIQAKNMENAVKEFLKYNSNIKVKSVLYEEGYLVDDEWNEYVFTQLGNKNYKMNYAERKEYFGKYIDYDLGIYLLRALDKLARDENMDYVNVLGELGMSQSSALEVLDAYGDENGWQQDE